MATAEKREVPPIVVPVEIVLTMTQEEANVLRTFLGDNVPMHEGATNPVFRIWDTLTQITDYVYY